MQLRHQPMNYDYLTKEAFDFEIQKGLDGYENNRIVMVGKVKE